MHLSEQPQIVGGVKLELSEVVALGGLFHDIGKPVQRGNLYSGDHSSQGAKFLEDFAMQTGREEFKLLALFSEFHHWNNMDERRMWAKIKDLKPERFGIAPEDLYRALWLVYEADNISSSEREPGSPSSYRPLASIFNRSYKYPLKVLDFNDLAFPVKEGVRLNAEDYKKLVRRFSLEVGKREVAFDRLLPLFEKYFTFVSSVTTENNYISLYDHMRMTSAIALAMLKAGCTVEDIKSGRCKSENRFLLIEGDFSGIQDFIYGVRGKGTLKYLRARSAYLELIGWDVVLEIIERLGLTRANVVFNAGGHFLIIGQNSRESREQLEEIRKEASRWLYNEFGGTLYLAVEWEATSGEELGKNFDRVRKRLGKKLTLRKLRRFEDVEELFNVEALDRMVECPVCGKEVHERELEESISGDGLNVCRTCNELAGLGGVLPKIQGFARVKKKYEGEIKRITKTVRGPFSIFAALKDVKDVEDYNPRQVLLKNSLDPENLPSGVKFIPYLVADYVKMKEGSEIVMDFDELAKSSLGTKRLGVLKGDVDLLGEFFGRLDTPSKLATASRFMDYFFKPYLNSIIEGKFEYIIGEVPSLKKWPDKPDIVVVYAGGDDLFIVGAWDEIFELAFRIREAFKVYAGEEMTISVGTAFFDPNLPIYRMAEYVSNRLETAKEEGRNRIFLIERTSPGDKKHPLTYEWENYKRLWKLYCRDRGLLNLAKEKKAPLWKILEIRDLYVNDPSSVHWAYLMAYVTARLGIRDKFPELAGIDANAVENGEPQPIYWVDGILKIVLMAGRR